MDSTTPKAPADQEQIDPATLCKSAPQVGQNSVCTSQGAGPSNRRVVGGGAAFFTVNRYKNTKYQIKRKKPGVVIVVHGVNDVGTSYGAIDKGLNQGMNERLNRDDLVPHNYLIPGPKDKVLKDPDKVYYRLISTVYSNSIMLAFYWGYRAAKNEIGKEQIHGENVDVHGNRLDKDFAKGGGMFANATSNIVDMFSGSFESGFLVWILDHFVADEIHSLRDAPCRQYMLLAAHRLAGLIKQLRSINPNETVTVLAHSQGTLITLLAQAILDQQGHRAADCAILVDSPYSLEESSMERLLLKDGMTQQTSHARLQTLINTTRLITDNPHSTPPLNELHEKHPDFNGRTGPGWTPTSAKRYDMQNNSVEFDFEEHDNRGTVTLTFCPHDQTVGLDNVQGIGTLGVPDTMILLTPDKTATQEDRFAASPTVYTETTCQPMQLLGPRFRQRVFTWYRSMKVGDKPNPKYELRRSDEEQYDGKSWVTRKVAYTTVDACATRNINAPALNPPIIPRLHVGETEPEKEDGRYQGRQQIDPIDARESIVKQGTRAGETDEEALQRIQTQNTVESSYHSAILAAEEHHRFVTAMDVPIGDAVSLDDEGRREVLRMIADWRSDLDPETLKKWKLADEYAKLDPDVRALADATFKYYKYGEFPGEDLVPRKIPDKIVSETLAQRAKGVKK